MPFNPNLYVGRGLNHTPLSENRDFSGAEYPLDLRPVCKFGSCMKKNWGGQAKFNNTFFPNSEIDIFDDFCRKDEK